MNKLKTTDVGGFPYVLDDIRFELDAVRKAFYGILTTWGINNEDSFILRGCVTSIGANISITEGYVSILGEVYFVPAHSISLTVPSGQEAAFVVVSGFDPAGLKTFDSGGTFNTYELRTAIVQYETIAATNFELFGAKTIDERIAIQSAPALGLWTTIDLNGSADVVQNSLSDGSGSDTVLSIAPTSGDFLKYNIIGNTVNLVWDLRIRTKTNDTAPAGSILIKNLPFSFESFNQFSTYLAKTTSVLDALSGVHDVLAPSGTNKLAFRIVLPQGSLGEFNRYYVMDVGGGTRVTATASTNVESTWDIRGSATFIIQ